MYEAWLTFETTWTVSPQLFTSDCTIGAHWTVLTEYRLNGNWKEDKQLQCNLIIIYVKAT